jgi:hypothetical protein
MAGDSQEKYLNNKTLSQVEKKKRGLKLLVRVDGC